MTMLRLVTTGTPLEQWMTWMTARGLSAATLQQRSTYGRSWCAWTDWEQAAPDDLAAWLARPHWAPETRSAALGAVRSLYAWAATTRPDVPDPTAGMPSVRVPRHRPRPTPDDVLAHALTACHDDRDLLCLLLGACMGLRRAEIAAVHGDDMDHGWLMVVGKGSQTRMVPVHPAAAPLLERLEGWAFPSPHGGHVHPNAVGERVRRLTGGGRWTTHTLRHRAATAAYRASHDLLAVQRLLGHASVATTQIYCASADDELRACVEAVRLPTAA